MSQHANPTKIGVFVLVAVVLAIAGIFVLGGLQLFREEIIGVAFFDGDVQGLNVGSPVYFRGVQLGQVSAVKIGLDPHNKIAVYMKLELKHGSEAPLHIRTQEDLKPFIDRGLRAQLKLVSVVTGQLSVSLDYLPNTPLVLTGIEPAVPELPTVPAQFAQYRAAVERVLATLERTDVAQLVQDIDEMARSFRALARSPELASALRDASAAFRSADVTFRNLDSQVATVGAHANVTLDDTRRLVDKVNCEFEPLAVSIRGVLDATRTTAESAQGTLATVNRAFDGDTRLGDEFSQALRQVTLAARSLNALADYLERHPEALLHGKPGPEVK